MAAVNIKNLGIQFGGGVGKRGSVSVIKDLNLQVADGEFLVLLGPSGCGKSTLLHSIAGLIDVSEGQIDIAGKDVTYVDPSKRGIGMVFQSYALYPTMTVERNMSFGLRVAGLPKAEIEQRVQRAAQMLQLGPLLQRKPAQLSGGQRQRVAIGRALVRDADVFLLDEPLSNLDAKLRSELRRELKALHKTLGSTMIYVTHDQVEAMTLATRIVVLRDGKIQQIGAPGEVYERPENLFVAGFLGAPGMNFVSGSLSNNSGGAKFSSSQIELSLAKYPFRASAQFGKPTVLGIRPENIRISANGAFSGIVQFVEPVGNHQIIWIEHSGLSLAVVVHDAIELSIDGPIKFDIDIDRVSLFDEADEQRL